MTDPRDIAAARERLRDAANKATHMAGVQRTQADQSGSSFSAQPAKEAFLRFADENEQFSSDMDLLLSAEAEARQLNNYEIGYKDGEGSGFADWISALAADDAVPFEVNDPSDVIKGVSALVQGKRTAEASLAQARELLAQAMQGLARLASGEGFEAIGVIPDDMWGREHRARIDYAAKLHAKLTREKP